MTRSSVRDAAIIFALAACAAACGSAGGFRFDGSANDAGPREDARAGEDARPGEDAVAGEDAREGEDARPNDDAMVNDDAATGRDAIPADVDVPASPTMSFFATSSGNGANGANFGGLPGADARCQTFAASAGAAAAAKTWHAYLSQSEKYPPGPVINAKDHIGMGPWFNYYGQMIAPSVMVLHTAGLDANFIFTEMGTMVPMDDHDVLTGSDENGDYRYGDTCGNWTDSTDGPESFGFTGHADWNLPNSIGNRSWNSSHRTGCSEAALFDTAGSGRLYCFAID